MDHAADAPQNQAGEPTGGSAPVSVERWDAADESALDQVVALEAAHSQEIWGLPDFAQSRHFWITSLQPTAYRERLLLLARRDPEIVGYVKCAFTLVEDQDLVDLELLVAPSHRRQGVGTALVQAAERASLEAGRTRAMCYAPQPDAPAEVEALVPPTGVGRVAADHPSTRFALKSGYRLEQSERHSLLRLPIESTDLPERTETGYRFHTWSGPTPEQLIDQLATLRSQMSVDIPFGELALERQDWDAERIRHGDQRLVEFGFTALVTVAERISDGELAAYTVIENSADHPQVGYQGDTFVLSSHRGHGLGLAIKVINNRAAAEQFGQLARVHTWNADENRWMLAINEALGFRPFGLETCWSRTF